MTLAIAILVVLFAAFSNGAAAQTIDELRQAVRSTTDRSAQAKLYKQLGDALIEHDNIEQAAAAFSEALAAGRENFSANERLQMAIYLSWADRLRDSTDELNRLLAEDPKNIHARTHLARVLSWSGELGAAIVEADKVLRDAPDHKEALLVKADALQWQGRYVDAIPIYQKILARDNDFDARVGLSRCLLAVRNRTGALENLNALKPGNARQTRELEKLTEAINQETGPTIEARYNHYHDSDRNNYDRYSLAGDFWNENQKYGLSFRHTDAQDPTRNNRAEDILFRIYSRLTDTVGAGAGIGFTQLDDHHTTNFPTGFVRFDTRLFGGSVGANLTHEVLSDTAELIENRIRMTNVGLYLSQPLTERFSVYGGYNYKTFSDGNHANDLQLTSQYAIYLTPRIVIGDRFRFLDYLEQSHSGYFDPNNYIANRVFSSIYYEHRFFYTYLEGYLGYQSFRRDGASTKEFIHGGSGSLGVKPMSNLAIEVNVEGGNFAAGSVAGFNYFIIGPRVLFTF
jgi:thioredoxin-like negative regulator of GroEL